ncbi:MAG: hypothetical protein GW892_30550 [Armatimonadetes bacterium]|nr:hypothetical protein [Armatimonadota bacterium]
MVCPRGVTGSGSTISGGRNASHPPALSATAVDPEEAFDRSSVPSSRFLPAARDWALREAPIARLLAAPAALDERDAAAGILEG